MKFVRYISFFISAYSFSQVECVKVDSDFSGFFFEYHQNGRISWVKEFANGSATGIWMLFDEIGNLIKQKDNRKISVKNINESVTCYGGKYEEQSPEELDSNYIFDFVDEDAEFPGGAAAMQKWIAHNLIFPLLNHNNIHLNGKIYISFVVEIDGSVSNVKIERGMEFCPECDAEGVRLIKSMPKWKPGRLNGKIIRCRCRLPIKFDFAG
jgi:hypothetical protein